VVLLDTHYIAINDLVLPHSATLMVDTLNRPLAAIPRGIYRLKAEEVWLFGLESGRSWD